MDARTAESASVALRMPALRAGGDADRVPRRMTRRRTQHPPRCTRHRGPGCRGESARAVIGFQL